MNWQTGILWREIWDRFFANVPDAYRSCNFVSAFQRAFFQNCCVFVTFFSCLITLFKVPRHSFLILNCVNHLCLDRRKRKKRNNFLVVDFCERNLSIFRCGRMIFCKVHLLFVWLDRWRWKYKLRRMQFLRMASFDCCQWCLPSSFSSSFSPCLFLFSPPDHATFWHIEFYTVLLISFPQNFVGRRGNGDDDGFTYGRIVT